MVSRETYRDGMARMAAAVNVITTQGPAGPGGFTASAVCSLTDDPATLLVCVNLSSRQSEILRGNGVLCVNTLAADQAPIAAMFSTRDVTMEARFALGGWSTLATGSPVLEGAVVSFDCRIVERLERGTHAVILCEALAVQLGHGEAALVYFDRHFRSMTGGDQGSR